MDDTRTKNTVLIGDIKQDPNQPRKTFTDKHISELATSILTEGFIHPIECDSEMRIIVGECRWRAAKQAGLTEIPVIINTTPFTPYERLRRQLSENMLQSSGDKTEMMNPVDVAKSLSRLIILKAYNTVRRVDNVQLTDFSSKLKFKDSDRLYEAISAYSNKDLIDVYHSIPREFLYGLVQEMGKETGISRETVYELLQLLDQPEFVIVDIQGGRPRTYYREADKAPKEVRETIKKKIAEGDYKSRGELREDILLARKSPDLATIELERKQGKESTEINRILNSVVRLGLALDGIPLEKIEQREQQIIIKQLNWIQDEIKKYLAEPKVLEGQVE